ncbi:MAG: enoyl-CoA hydratase-related protein [Vicinamibacterales bacterium]
MAFTHLLARREGAVEHLTLNRPELRNAFNEEMIDEISEWALSRHADLTVRAAVLGGAGPVFSAGGDLSWMARTVEYTREQNLADAEALARMYSRLDTLPFPLVGCVHGAALGGAAGLAAVCDIVVAARDAVFGFTEVRLGILPAIISPYVVAKIGPSAARELFLTGARFSAERAREIGLVHTIVGAEALDDEARRVVDGILACGPQAVAAIKGLIRRVAAGPSDEAAGLAAEVLADARVSAEGQEGLRAFLEKRRASWRDDPDTDRRRR